MLEQALQHLPLVAILRGVKPDEVEAIADVLYTEGFRVIEVPLNSPQALDSIGRLAHRMPAEPPTDTVPSTDHPQGTRS